MIQKFFILFILSSFFSSLFAENPDPKRFEKTIEEFIAYDKKNSSPEKAVLFVGSSSIRLWGNLKEDMDGLIVLNRGFGGAHISDVIYYYDQVIKPHKPSKIVMFCGANDAAAGKTPDVIFSDFKTFYDKVKTDYGHLPIYYISLNPNPNRWEKWPLFQEVNHKIETFCQGQDQLHFVDISKATLGEDGKPLPNIWMKDLLHMNQAGYDIWAKILKPMLR